MGSGRDYPNGIENQQTPFIANITDGNISSLPVSREMINARSLDEQTTVDNCQLKFNTAAGKCVTLQQYKEQGAPKYAVLAT